MKEEKKSSSLILLFDAIIVVLLIAVILIVVDKKDDHDVEDVRDNLNEQIPSDNQGQYMTKDEILQLVLLHAKIERTDIRNLDIELDYKYGTYVYEVDFDYNQYEYEYYVDATSGKILHSFREFDF